MSGTITALRFQKKNADRVNIYLDGQFALGVPALAAAALKPGQHLSDEAIIRLKAQDEEQRAYERALRFLARRPRSTAEVRQNLRKHDTPDLVSDIVIERLLKVGYLDEEAFARFWVSDRERFKPKGRIALRYELRQKGVADSIIDKALEAVDSENSAYRAGAQRAPRLANLEKPAFRQKLGAYLLRRGFSHQVVWPVVAQLWEELDHETHEEEAPDWL